MGRWPGSVYREGVEPDPRFTFANERTFLAWLRTSLALVVAGVAVDVLAESGDADVARRYADAGELRLAAHFAELAVQADADDTTAHAARAEVYGARAKVEDSLMARGIFTWAAAESRKVTDGTGPQAGPAARLLAPQQD